MRTTLNLDDELVRAAKDKATAESRSLTSVIEDGLRAVLRPAETPVDRIVLPTFGGDGPAGGLDIQDWDAVKDRLSEDADAAYRAASPDAAS